ncbi:MAG: hypothetical protein HY922_04760 [Elusimicrobia bacterium]|nr:hypothetical protein [Elusimicrobiota bacterium]
MSFDLRHLFAALTLAALAGPALAEDTVFLKNGDRITGFVMSDDGQRLKLGTVYGTVFVEKRRIQEIKKSASGGIPDRVLIVPPPFKDGEPPPDVEEPDSEGEEGPSEDEESSEGVEEAAPGEEGEPKTAIEEPPDFAGVGPLQREPMRFIKGQSADEFLGVEALPAAPRLIFSAQGGAEAVDPSSGKSSFIASSLPSSSFSKALDADGDGKMEFAFSAREEEKLRLQIVDGKGRKLKEFEDAGNDDSGIALLELTALRRKGPKIALAAISSGYSQQPRGVAAFDYETGKKLWFYAVGPAVTTLEAADIDGDGVKEVVFGSYAPANGAQAPDGTDDSHSYVWVLDDKGKLRWKKEFGGHFTGVNIACRDLTGKGKPSIVASTSAAWRFRKDEGRIAVLDSKGAVVWETDMMGSVYSAEFFPEAQGLSILATGRMGGVLKYGADGKPLGSAEFSWANAAAAAKPTLIKGIADFDGDGKPEIAAVSWEEEPKISNPRTDRGPKNVTIYRNAAVWILGRDLKPLRRTVLAKESLYPPRVEVLPGKPAAIAAAQGREFSILKMAP